MGAYIFILERDRISKRKVTDEYINAEFQEALIYCPSLMIEERIVKVKKGIFKKRTEDKSTYTIYHESPAHDGSAYEAALQFSGSGNKQIVIAYLHGIINGAVRALELTPTHQQG